MLVPCDPVITVAPDILFFECFSADESSYGCLTIDREAFHAEEDVALGTTNVDYSWELYEQFQKLRAPIARLIFKSTRLVLEDFRRHRCKTLSYREEKIDLHVELAARVHDAPGRHELARCGKSL